MSIVQGKFPALNSTRPRTQAGKLSGQKIGQTQALLHPAAWHALAVAAKKSAASSRDDLVQGQRYEVDAKIRVRGTLTVGFDTTADSTVTPSVESLLAAVFGKLTRATRASVVRQVLADYAASNGGELPDAAPEAVEAAGEFLGKLRRRVPQPRRGAVAGNFQVSVIGGCRKPAAKPAEPTAPSTPKLRLIR